MRCRPGILAVVERDAFPANVGRVVEVLHPVDGRPYDAPGPNWQCRCPSLLDVGYYDHRLGQMVGPYFKHHEAAFRDTDLCPISGPGIDIAEQEFAPIGRADHYMDPYEQGETA